MEIFDAARGNNVAALKEQLNPLNVNDRDGRGSTPLIIAAYYNNSGAVKALLDAGADPELQDSMGNTALMGACFKGYPETVKVLLENGASVHTANGNAATALTFAANFGRNELITLLLEYGANPLQKDNFGKNPIDYALVQENAAGYEMLVAAARIAK